MSYSNLYEIRSVKDATVDPRTGEVIGSLQIDEPFVNAYEAGTVFHVFPYANKVLVVSKTLEVTLDHLLTEVIKPEEAELLKVGANQWEALNKFAMLIAEIEGLSTSDELINMDGWVECKMVAEQAADVILLYSKEEMTTLYNNMKSIQWARNIPANSTSDDNIETVQMTI